MNQLRSAEEIMYGKLWGPDCPSYEKDILQLAINGAKEYAQQFKEQQKEPKYTLSEAMELIQKERKALGANEFHKKDIHDAEERGYRRALEDVVAKINKVLYP